MRILLTLLALSVSTVALAQTPAPDELGTPIAPDEAQAPSVPAEVEVPPAPDDEGAPAPAAVAEGAGDDDDERADEDDTSDREPGPFWAAAAAGALPCLGVDVVGGALTGLGCVFASIAPGGSAGDNCVESCVLGIISAGIVVLGMILAIAGLVVLGPVGALVVTVAASVGSALAGRAFWGAALGGIPGVLLGAAGLAVAGYGFSDMSIDTDGLSPGLFSGDPRSTLVLGGIGMAAAAGVVALVGALVGDIAFTSLLGDDEEEASKRASRRLRRDELPLAYRSAPPLVMAY